MGKSKSFDKLLRDEPIVNELSPRKVAIQNPFTLSLFARKPKPYEKPSMTIPGQIVPMSTLVKHAGISRETLLPENAIFNDELDSLGIDPRSLDLIDLETMIAKNRSHISQLREQSHAAQILFEQQEIERQQQEYYEKRQKEEAKKEALSTNTP